MERVTRIGGDFLTYPPAELSGFRPELGRLSAFRTKSAMTDGDGRAEASRARCKNAGRSSSTLPVIGRARGWK
jgi:hypothetical protein